MVKVWRSVRMSEGLIQTVEKFLKTKQAERLGLFSLKDVIEYCTRKWIDDNTK